MSGMYFSSDPAVSCILFPADGSTGSEEILLSVSDDYSVGKLIRTGLDAVYGRGRRGERIYDPNRVRRGILSIEEHAGRYKAKGANPRALAHQGHGNIGLNNWAIAYRNIRIGTLREPPNTEELVLPAGEPAHERIYPCFVKSHSGKQRYRVMDLVIFCAPDAADGLEVVDWVPESKAPAGASFAAQFPDRELDGDEVFIPIWEERLSNSFLTTLAPDSRIDWTGTGVRFVKVRRNCRGTVDSLQIILVPLMEVEAGHRIREPLTQVEFAFFGIPVETLANRSLRSPRDLPRLFSPELARLSPYFYDLRHLFDLIGVRKDPSKPEFYLLEYALKKDDFAEARRFLETQRNPSPLAVDVGSLLSATKANGADPSVLETLGGFISSPSALVSTLEDKGYKSAADKNAISVPGEFCIEWNSCGPGNALVRLYVMPLRNVYSYSFVGLVTGPDNRPYVLLAVTGGAGGIRPGRVEGRTAFAAPLRTAMELEAAVRTLLVEHLQRLWDQSSKPGSAQIDAHHADDNRLLLLDQGADVHQWVASGGVNYVIGSSLDRSLLSALLVVVKP